MDITLSIVSHGHSKAVPDLLVDLNSYKGSHSLQIVLTWNAPELESAAEAELRQLSVWPLTLLRNSKPRGFAENHNAALQHAKLGVWCVVNPDIRFAADELDALPDSLARADVVLSYPRQTSLDGQALDYRRELVTPWSLLKRYFFRWAERPARPDWVSGCFMAFRSEVYQALGGFDERYFLYCEDVDICLRLQLAGYKMAEADFSIIHDTRRGTLKKFSHFKWHVGSLLRLWCSHVFWAYLWNRSKIKAR